MRDIELPSGDRVPVLGQGTWRLGEDPAKAAEETRAIRAGVECGLRVIDTAEMYGDGATERFLGAALHGLRNDVFLVSKACPQNAGRKRLPTACEGSLKRLNTDRLDLYLLHWRGTIPLAETVEAMQGLQQAGKIRQWGVSNFDTADMTDLIDAGGQACATDQVLYNLGRRGAEFDLLPWLDRHRMPAMAYSPVEQGRLDRHGRLTTVARRRDATPLQIALAWLLARPGLIVIPKAGTVAHVRENAAAADIELMPDDVADLDQAFPPPHRKQPLAML